MTNLVLFLVSTVGYYLFGWFLHNRYMRCDESPYPHKQALAICALLALPVNINGHVFTIAGNAQGEKGIYSLASLYQKTDNGNAYALVFSGYQQAAGNAVIFLGFSGYQQAGGNTATVVGVSGCQLAGESAVTLVGVSGYQRARLETVTGLGFSGYQHADKLAGTFVGLALCQKVQDKVRVFAAFTPLRDYSKIGAK